MNLRIDGLENGRRLLEIGLTAWLIMTDTKYGRHLVWAFDPPDFDRWEIHAMAEVKK